jgi:hypothetical protein
MPRAFILYILVSTILMGCGQSSFDDVFHDYLDGIRKTKDYAEVRSKLKDSMDSWIHRQLYELLFYPKVNWKIDDAVFFDKDRSKALLLILAQVKDSTWPEDYVKVVGAEKLAGHWEFYYASYVVNIFRRSANGGQPFSFPDLARLCRKEIIEDGFVKCVIGCKIDYDYIDSDIWFADWRRKWHKDFLRNALPRHPVEKPGGMFF